MVIVARKYRSQTMMWNTNAYKIWCIV